MRLLRSRLLATNAAAWLTSTLVTGGTLFVRSVRLSPDASRTAWMSLMIGAAVSLPIVMVLAIVRSRRLADPLSGMLDMTRAMLSGKFRERFFPDTDTEIDRLGADLNQLAGSLRAKMQDLRDSHARLEATLNASVSGIVIVDSEGFISAVNQAARDILGRPGDDLHGQSFPAALANSNLSSLVSGALYRHAPGRQEVKLGRQTQKVVDATAVPLSSDEDSSRPVTSGVVLTMHDLTEIRRLERMRSDFVQNVSHELRTPVTVVKGFAETLRDTPPEDVAAVREMAGLIETEASRLSTLVGSLLDLARLESGSVVPAKSSLDPGRLVRDTVRRLEAISSRKGQTISVVEEVPQGSALQADPSLMDAVLTNLLENAVKYAGDGGHIEAGVHPQDDGWLFHVTDDGPGIAEEDLPRVFERFYRGAKDRSRGTGGSGLGLAVVKHCVALHSGKVWAESRQGEGASFYVWLP